MIFEPIISERIGANQAGCLLLDVGILAFASYNAITDELVDTMNALRGTETVEAAAKKMFMGAL